MNIPELTVLMPVYNVAPYIKEAIDSILAQSYKDFELLIIDDGSDDDTKRIITGYSDPRIRLVDQQHKGVAAALNTGLRLARGGYIARFDGDDICLPGRLETQIHFLEQNPSFVVTGGDAEYVDEDGAHLFYFRSGAYTDEEIKNIIRQQCPFIHATVMYRRSVIMETGGYPENAHTFEDHLLWVQLMERGKYCNLPTTMIKVRINPASVTIDEKWRDKRFRELKKNILQKGNVTEEEGKILMRSIINQTNEKVKRGAYHALCGKKYLLDNHEPALARQHLAKAVRLHPLRLDNYLLYTLSLLPASFTNWLHKTLEQR